MLKGLAGLTVLAAGGVVWRAWDNGVFHVGAGPAYEPWHDWHEVELDGPLALVHAGILASNAHNTQPWRFHVAEERIAVFADHDRHLGTFDPYRREMALSLGCAIENMVQAARAKGLAPRVELSPDRFGLGGPAHPDQAVAVIPLARGERIESELFRAISHRHTHRGAYDSERPVAAELADEMQELGGERRDIRLFLYPAGAARQRLGEIIIAATEDIIADHEMARDSAKWFRFDWSSIQEHRDGVTLDTVGLPPLINTAAKIVPAPTAEQADQQWLDATRDVHVATAPLLGMIAVTDLYDQPTTLDAGRLWQRLHLWATARGLAAQPLNMPPERVDHEAELSRAPPGPLRRLRQLAADETIPRRPRTKPSARSPRPARTASSSIPTSGASRSTCRSSCRCSRWRAGTTSRSCCTRSAAPICPTTRARTAPDTRSGGPSAGRTRPAPRWRASCLSGMFDRFPDLKIVTHHLGAMVPYFEGRVGPGWDQLGARTSDEDLGAVLQRLNRRPLDYFKDFYADSAVFGSRAATVCGLEFFGPDRVLFASDSPFDPEKGPDYIRDTIKVLESLDLEPEARAKINHRNAERLFGLPPG